MADQQSAALDWWKPDCIDVDLPPGAIIGGETHGYRRITCEDDLFKSTCSCEWDGGEFTTEKAAADAWEEHIIEVSVFLHTELIYCVLCRSEVVEKEAVVYFDGSDPGLKGKAFVVSMLHCPTCWSTGSMQVLREWDWKEKIGG